MAVDFAARRRHNLDGEHDRAGGQRLRAAWDRLAEHQIRDVAETGTHAHTDSGQHIPAERFDDGCEHPTKLVGDLLMPRGRGSGYPKLSIDEFGTMPFNGFEGFPVVEGEVVGTASDDHGDHDAQKVEPRQIGY